MPVRTALILAAMGLLCGPACAQSTATATASCVIVMPLQIRSESPLAFGALSVGPDTGGTVTIQPGGGRSTGGAVALQGGSWAAARFVVSGEDGAAFLVALPDQCLLNSSGGAPALVADGFACSLPSPGVLAGGMQAIGVGATLHVPAGQPVGTYTGTFDVTVSYQ
jgi:hypothetical protein